MNQDHATILAELAAIRRRVEEIQRFLRPPNRAENLRQIQLEVASAYNVPTHIMRAAGRTYEICWPRQVAMALCRWVLKYPFPEVGKAFDRDHTTVIHACQAVIARCETSRPDRAFVVALQRQLETQFGIKHHAPTTDSATPPDTSPL